MSETGLGTESLLGTADGEDAQTLRDRLALASLYLANWYRATEGTAGKTLAGVDPDTTVWWQKIDVVRRKVEATYQELQNPLSEYFAGPKAKVMYDDASASWAALYRELALSADTIDVSLIDQAASFGETLFKTPGLLVPEIGNQIGKAVGGALGAFLSRTWPYLLGAAALAGVYVFRRPIVAALGKVAA